MHPITRDSTSIDQLFLDIKGAQAVVRFKNDGKVYVFEQVNRMSMLNLIRNKSMRLGGWVNKNLVHLKEEDQ